MIPFFSEHPKDAEEIHLSDPRQVVITTIRATDMTLGLRWIPASFYMLIHAEGAHWQTTNKSVHVDHDIIDWNEPIVLPSDLSCNVRFGIHVSFELGPMLGHGDLLRTFDISVAELLDRSENSRPIVFQPKVGEVVSPCTSLFITMEQPYSRETTIGDLCPITISTPNDFILITNAGHCILGRYRGTQDITDLEQSIKHFERARDLCPDDHPCLPAALFNLAEAKFINCQVKGTYLNLDLDIPISLFRDALDLRPTGHPDRPTTQLHLAIALLSRFTKFGVQTDADAAEQLLNEVLDICHVKSHIYRSALLAINTYVSHTDANDRPVEEPMAHALPWSLNELSSRAEQCKQSDDAHALDEVISRHHEALKYDDMAHAQRGQLLSNLGTALYTRFERQGIAHDLDEAITFHREALHLHIVGHTNQSSSLMNLANALFTRFLHQRNDKDLEEAITFHREALNLHPVGHSNRSLSLNTLADVLSARFLCQGNDKDLDEAIISYREALHLHSIGHPNRSKPLHCLANALLMRFENQSNEKDLEEAIKFHREVLRLHPVGHSNRSTALHSLASALFTCFEHRGHDKDLEEVIAFRREALDLHPVDHPHWSSSLISLAIALSTRFKHQGNDKDLEEAITFYREALHLLPVGHPNRSMSSNNLANALYTRFNHQGNDKDLEEAIRFHKEELHLHPAGHPARSSSLNNLANAFSARFRHRGNDKDLEEAIAFHREALDLHPVGHPYRPTSLNGLANALTTRFEHKGNVEDIEEAIVFHREALHSHPVGHPNRSLSLINLPNALLRRFENQGNDKDLDEAVTLHREAIHLHPIGHPGRSLSLHDLADVLSTRFERRGNNKDLEEAITFHTEALHLRPVGHPARSKSLNSLAHVLYTRFEHQGNDKDLEGAITFSREALHLHAVVCHPDQPQSLVTLANALLSRFKHQGDVKDLDEAIAFYREALHLDPVGHPNRSKSSNNLANALFTRFEHQGNDNDLEEAITLHRKVLHLHAVVHPDRPQSLTNLAIVLSVRFTHQGNGEDLEEAIVFHREALHLHPVGHPNRSTSLNSLATALSARFKHQGNDKDLDDAIAFYREALHLHPPTHPFQSMTLNNLANALSDRFKHRGNDKDLEEAIGFSKEVLHLHPVGHPDRSKSLNNLANALSTRFLHQRNNKDLKRAIKLHRETLDLRPFGHPDRSSSLYNLATMLLNRFEQCRNDKDIDKAIAFYRESLHLRPVGHPMRSSSLSSLGSALSIRFKHQGNDEDLHEALANARSALSLFATLDPGQSVAHGTLANIYLLFHQSKLHPIGEDVDNLNAAMDHHKAAAELISSGFLSRLKASLCWLVHAHQHRHSTLLEAYAFSIRLLDGYMSVTASVSSRHHTMKLFPRTLAVDAASCALQGGDVCHAVELLEQGRTLIWTQMARLRVPLDSLQERGDEAEAAVKKFRKLSSLLDKPPAELPEGTPRIQVEAEATRYTRLVDDWSKIVEEIRTLEGFSRFLLPPLFSDLQNAARHGPIIVLIASEFEAACNAIIIPHQQSPVSIHLATNFAKLQQQVVALRQTVQGGSSGGRLIGILRELWVDIVCPVVEHLDKFKFAQPGSRIWWCPTSFFNFLPLHAAGEYRKDGTNLSKLYISSYTPSLTALTRARKTHDRSQLVHFAAIGQNHPPGFKFALPSVEPELELVQSLLPPASRVSFSKVTSIESTKSVALRTLRDHHWLHFACHGTQNFEEPFNSAFHMRDKPLTLLDITQTDLSRHEFAFLSACETAVGDMQTPDEVIHLAAGLQFAGVKSVIGTFWSVEDSTVRYLVEAFYKNFCGDGKMNSKRAALALHRAVQSIARNTDIPLEQRIVFMHIGL